MHIPVPEAEVIEALEKAWGRNDLQRYLIRWTNSEIPAVPARWLDFQFKALDLACGFGLYLLQQSEAHPERGYLGVDKGSLRGGSMVQRFANVRRRNLFGLHTNAIPLLAAMPDGILDQLTIFYPNPWWPPKHRKKRWSFHPLLPKLTTLLKPGGTLLIASNEAFYLGEFKYAIENHPQISGMRTDHAGAIQTEAGRSHFEVKFMAEGTPCGEVRFTRTAGELTA